MMVNITVPNDLEEYLEYIPETQLENVFLEALRYKISNSCGTVFNYEDETERLASLISEKLINNSDFRITTGVMESSSSVIPTINEDIRKPVVTTIEVDLDDDDDLGDFMDLMK